MKYLEDHKSELIPGWHVPTKTEWIALFTAVGGTSVAGTKLKSTTGWASGNGDGYYGFAAQPAGYRNTNNFYNLGSEGHFWTVTTDGSSGQGLYFNTNASIRWDSSNKSFCKSVRIVKDS